MFGDVIMHEELPKLPVRFCENLLNLVAAHFGAERGAFREKFKQESERLLRRSAMYLCRKYTMGSQEEVAAFFDSHGTTVKKGVKFIEAQMKRVPAVRRDIMLLESAATALVQDFYRGPASATDRLVKEVLADS